MDVLKVDGHAMGKGIAKRFDDETVKQAHQYVLFNCEMVKPYLEQHRGMIDVNNPRAAPHQKERIHCEEFAYWFSNHISKEDPICQDLICLARGPNHIGLTYQRYVINGFKFHTRDLERQRKTQNNGIKVHALTSSFSSIRDQNPILSELNYFGILTEIIELDYISHRVVLFGCDWVSKGSRLKQDGDGFTIANFTNVRPHKEPFILASQASQVFYVTDPVDNNWQVVISTSARGNYDMQPMADVETYLQSNICNHVDNGDSEPVLWIQEGVDGVEVDRSM